MNLSIPIYSSYLPPQASTYVNEALDSTWISSRGKFVVEFESKFSKKFNHLYSSTCSNGTVALHLALLALGIGPGDEVIVPSFTYIASVNAISYVGATPVFVDVDPHTWNLSYDSILSNITDKTKAIIVVHIYGLVFDLSILSELPEHIFLVEDCAEALGSSSPSGYSPGTSSHITTYSFFGNKTLTTGEGGMVSTNDSVLIDLINRFKSQSLCPSGAEYVHDNIGYNYRLTNIASAIGVSQLESFDVISSKKRYINSFYIDRLCNYVEFQQGSSHSNNLQWLTTFLCSSFDERIALRQYLHSNGVDTRPTFPLVSSMVPYQHIATSSLSNSEDISLRGLSIPSFPGLSDKELSLISSLIVDFYR